MKKPGSGGSAEVCQCRSTTLKAVKWILGYSTQTMHGIMMLCRAVVKRSLQQQYGTYGAAPIVLRPAMWKLLVFETFNDSDDVKRNYIIMICVRMDDTIALWRADRRRYGNTKYGWSKRKGNYYMIVVDVDSHFGGNHQTTHIIWRSASMS